MGSLCFRTADEFPGRRISPHRLRGGHREEIQLEAPRSRNNAACSVIGKMLAASDKYADEATAVWHANHFVADEVRQKTIESLAPGRQKVWSGLTVAPTDITIIKNRYSALISGSSGLERLLRSLGIDTVLIAGTKTNVCCEATARDAMMLDFKERRDFVAGLAVRTSAPASRGRKRKLGLTCSNQNWSCASPRVGRCAILRGMVVSGRQG